jgi:RimJ/RimL family protein N-acetyltransferase
VTQPVYDTSRLRVVDAASVDLEALLEVYLSNPRTLAVTEGSAGEPGRYDRGMLERDLWIAGMEPERTSAALVLASSGEPVGAMDWVERHPERDIPWLGMLMLHADHQRQGLGREALEGLAVHGRSRGWKALGAGCLSDDGRARAFLTACGLAQTGETSHGFAAGTRPVALWRLGLERG